MPRIRKYPVILPKLEHRQLMECHNQLGKDLVKDKTFTNEERADLNTIREEIREKLHTHLDEQLDACGSYQQPINIDVHVNDGIIFIFKMIYISFNYVPLPFVPPTVIAIDLAQSHLRKKESISSKMVHKIFPGRKKSQIPSIGELQAEANYTTETREFQVVDTHMPPPPPA